MGIFNKPTFFDYALLVEVPCTLESDALHRNCYFGINFVEIHPISVTCPIHQFNGVKSIMDSSYSVSRMIVHPSSIIFGLVCKKEPEYIDKLEYGADSYSNCKLFKTQKTL